MARCTINEVTLGREDRYVVALVYRSQPHFGERDFPFNGSCLASPQDVVIGGCLIGGA